MSRDNPHARGMNGAVAAELRAERAAQGLTNDDIADRSGIPKVSVQRYLATTRAIDVEVLDLLAAAVGLDVRELVRRAERRLGRQGAPLSEADEVVQSNLSPGTKDYILRRLEEIRAADAAETAEPETGASTA